MKFVQVFCYPVVENENLIFTLAINDFLYSRKRRDEKLCKFWMVLSMINTSSSIVKSSRFNIELFILYLELFADNLD